MGSWLRKCDILLGVFVLLSINELNEVSSHDSESLILPCKYGNFDYGSVEISDSDGNAPWKLKRGQTYTISYKFKSLQAIHGLQACLLFSYVKDGNHPQSFVDSQNDDRIKNIDGSPAVYPLEPGKEYLFVYKFQVPESVKHAHFLTHQLFGNQGSVHMNCFEIKICID